MQAQMLAPAAVLVVWTLIVLLWIIPARFGALAKVEDKSALAGKKGARGQDLEGVIPDKANWPAHNHTHLHEQPTLFYAVSVILAIVGAGAIDVTLAWIYVALRIVHSLWQILVNKIPLRFILFLASSIVLIVLAVRAVMATAFADPSIAPQ
ncbi:MAPEG family protein [Erythrobacter sp. SCSIO 43205]|uniref:MAPEG family protein n=1 Tax=Erythrobacter sp. SCSIO 43205 TaxID=2779361 RepID=UPI001CA8F381|nr:MAPEG family protein [Erythrobacter sp. SCSIO 43205]UAB76869.1 MAPEG family protein [Erythrobacter sp. SCSIO 43205]